MLNVVWLVMLLTALVCGALTGKMDAVAAASTTSAKAAVELAIGLVGVMAFWIGAMRVLQQAGVMRWIAIGLAPVMRFLFPGVPADHPAMSMMIMNMASNMLGLGNAATPFGLKAMLELDRLNEHKGTATDAMALFLAINTSNVAILPTGMIAMRASLGSEHAGAILVPTLLATTCSTLVAIVVARSLARIPYFSVGRVVGEQPEVDGAEQRDVDTSEAQAVLAANPPLVSGWRLAVVLTTISLVTVAVGYGIYEVIAGTPAALLGLKEALNAAPVQGKGIGDGLMAVAGGWPLPLLIAVIAFIGMSRRVKMYDCIVEGGKEGFQIALKIIPYLVAILVAVGMLRASGAIELLVAGLEETTMLIGMPAEALPMALLRSLSGSGAYAVSAEIMQTHGTDSLTGLIVSTMQGSTETTFYVLALYFGVVQVRRGRYTLIACLVADTVGILAAVWAVRLLFPGGLLGG